MHCLAAVAQPHPIFVNSFAVLFLIALQASNQVNLQDLEICFIALNTISSPSPTLPLYIAQPSPKILASLTG